MAKMIRKAQQTRKTMSKIMAAGKSKSQNTTILLNGLTEIEDIEFGDLLFADGNKEALKQQIKKEVIEAFKDAKKNLETQLSQSMDLDSIRDMLS